MTKKYFIHIVLIVAGLFVAGCGQNKLRKIAIPQDAQPLPKALFITTGVNFNREDPSLPPAIVLAVQELSKNGIPVKLADRNILYHKDKLTNYQILILLTAKDIHDADREFSLSYMTDKELENIKDFVRNGGFLISGDNLGRNTYEGDDRILEGGTLNPGNYALSEVYGMILNEVNIKNFAVSGRKIPFKHFEKPGYDDDFWMATGIKAISDKLDTLAVWHNGTAIYPAVTRNKYGNGVSYWVGLSGWLVPANDGGESSIAQIEKFYDWVAQDYYKQKALPVQRNLWPGAHQAAFAVSFNIADTLPPYKFVIEKLKQQQIKPTFFVSGTVKKEIRDFLKNQKVDLASSGYAYANYTSLDFADATQDILQNEAVWQEKFTGFRFPFTTPGYKGMLALQQNDYTYDSSISANHLDFILGSIVPYNLVLAGQDYYQTTDIFEVAPTYHDDYFFIGKLKTGDYKTPKQLHKDVLRYGQYLQDYWQYAVKPNKGLMLVLAHPDLTGHNEQTFSALQKMIDTVKSQNVWLTSLPSVVRYFKDNERVSLFVKNDEKQTLIYVKAEPDVRIKNYAVRLDFKPEKAVASTGTAEIKQVDDVYYVVFDAMAGQKIVISK